MSLPVVREVGNVERYSLARSNADVYHGVIVGTRIQAQSRPHAGPQTTGLLPTDQAQWVTLLTGPLTWLIQRHAVLSVVMGDHLSGRPTFLRLPSIDLAQIIQMTTIATRVEIAKVLASEHTLPIDVSDHKVPLWRIIVVEVEEDKSAFILYKFHHAIGDGRSATALTAQLVEQLNVQASQAPASSQAVLPTVVASCTDPLPLPLEKRVNCSPRVSTLLQEIPMALLVPAFLKKAIQPKYWSGEFDATLKGPNETQSAIWYLTQEETQQLVKTAKARGTTVQSILFTASCFAIKSVFLSKISGGHYDATGDKVPNEDSLNVTTTKDKLSFATPVALRRLVSPPIAWDDQGNYVSELVTKNIKVDLKTDFWELTNNYRQQLIQGTTTRSGLRALLELVGLLEFLSSRAGEWEEYLKDQVVKQPHGRSTTLMLSNVGKAWDQQHYLKPEAEVNASAAEVVYKIEDALFSQSSSIIGPAFALNTATANNVLSMTCVWQKHSFSSQERGEVYMNEFKRIVLQAIEPERKDYSFQDAVMSSPVVPRN
ncbi:hypothetical protein EDD11_010527 [Mortierella claussenii]|nr:hypothetical protein EDD11_010527 [Mortierella claussenii]